MKDRWQMIRDATFAMEALSSARGIPLEEIVKVIADPRVEEAIVNAAIEARR